MAESDVLEQGRREVGLSISALWIRYFALGGMNAPLEMEAVLFGALVASPPDRDLLAVALNERFSELGADHPIPYSDD
jgi:hypothetical protein